MSKYQLSKEFRFEVVSEVVESLFTSVQEMQNLLEQVKNHEHFSMDVLDDFYERVELAHQILYNISDLRDPQSRIEDLLYQLREIDEKM